MSHERMLKSIRVSQGDFLTFGMPSAAIRTHLCDKSYFAPQVRQV